MTKHLFELAMEPQAVKSPTSEWQGEFAGETATTAARQRTRVASAGQNQVAPVASGIVRMPADVLQALRQKREPLAVQLAARNGLRDLTELTYLIFLARHPNRQGRWLKRREPQFAQFSREWTEIRERIVRPALAQQSGGLTARSALPGQAAEIPFAYEIDTEGGPAEGTVAAVALGFEVLKSTISTMTQGDIEVTWPISQIGVTWPGKPNIAYKALNRSELIIVYHKANPISGIEQVNVKLRCHVVYNGPEVQATFSFDAGGKRSRLMRETNIVINNPLSLETRPAPEQWRRVGVREYPIIRIPVEFMVDHPWPQDNLNMTFMLVLSGMYGFGAGPGSSQHIVDKKVVWN
ncbi:MAG: hypothetical protein ACKVZH_11450 [Blastocatellia bacterium]